MPHSGFCLKREGDGNKGGNLRSLESELKDWLKVKTEFEKSSIWHSCVVRVLWNVNYDGNKHPF